MTSYFARSALLHGIANLQKSLQTPENQTPQGRSTNFRSGSKRTWGLKDILPCSLSQYLIDPGQTREQFSQFLPFDAERISHSNTCAPDRGEPSRDRAGARTHTPWGFRGFRGFLSFLSRKLSVTVI